MTADRCRLAKQMYNDWRAFASGTWYKLSSIGITYALGIE